MRAPSGAQYWGAGFPSLSRELGAFLAWPALFTLGSRTLLWGGVSVAWLRSGCFPATRLERGFPENASSPGGSQGFPEPRAGGEPRVGLPHRGAEGLRETLQARTGRADGPGPASALLLKSTGSQQWTHLQAQKRHSSNVYSAFGWRHLFLDSLRSKSRMFRVQFSGESQEEALERCCSCVQTLAQYVTVQAPDSMAQQLQQSPDPLGAGESQGKDPLQQGPYLNHEQQVCVAAGTGVLEGRISVMHLAQTILASEKLPQAYEQSSWGAEELGPFLRLCLMDQNFPAFVEEVEKELKKITQS